MATDDLECKALSHKKDLIDIYSNSWGPDDRGFAVAGPGPLTRDALKKGAEEVIECSAVFCGMVQSLCQKYLIQLILDDSSPRLLEP